MAVFAIDFDGTFTEDPELFHQFVNLLKKRDHDVILVTQRGEEYHQEIQDVILDRMLVLHCPGIPKWTAARQAGIDVDIWIEDNPHALFNGFVYTGGEQTTDEES